MSKNIEDIILSLEYEIYEDVSTVDKLNSIHHVLSEATLSLKEEYKEGMTKQQVDDLYNKVNTAKSLLFYELIKSKRGCEKKERNISFLSDKLIKEREY